MLPFKFQVKSKTARNTINIEHQKRQNFSGFPHLAYGLDCKVRADSVAIALEISLASPVPKAHSLGGCSNHLAYRKRKEDSYQISKHWLGSSSAGTVSKSKHAFYEKM